VKRSMKLIALFLVFCFINTISPLPVFAASASEAIKRLTPQQKQQIKDLTPAEKNEIKGLLGLETQSSQSPNQATQTIKEEATLTGPIDPEELKAAEEGELIEEELSQIEEGYQEKISDRTKRPLRQFGYDIFSKTVGRQFTLIPSVPVGPDYRIHPGDDLLVTIWGNVNDTFALRVDERGAVTLPKVGVVALAGLILAEARDVLYERLATIFVADFNIDLTVKEVGSIKVYLLGDFKKPGAYTILANTSLYDAIFIGGGPTRKGTLRNIKLVRNGKVIRTVDLYDFILTGNKNDDVLLQSGDVIRVPQIGDVVAISGNVRNPAIYELMSTRTELSDFISLAGGVTPTTYLQRIQIERKEANIEETALDINYADYLKTKYAKPLYLKNEDFIAVFSIEPVVRNVVYLSGNVNRPGRYELDPKMSLMDLFVKADGLAPGTYMERAQIVRIVPPKIQPEIIAVNLTRMKMGVAKDNPELKEFDNIRVYSKEEIEGIPMVHVSGDVVDGDNSYLLTEDMNVSDLIFLAGGVKDSAYLKKAELVRFEPPNKTYFYEVDLDKVLKEGDRSQDYLLQANDYLFVRQTPDYGVDKTVTMVGNVIFPGAYAIYQGERLSSVIGRAGGYTSNAFLSGAIFVRESIKEEQEIDAQRLKSQLEERKQRDLAQLPIGMPSEEAAYHIKQINATYDFEYKKMDVQIPGRLLIDFNKIKPGNREDILLQDGDRIIVPNYVNNVTVMGEVYSPGTIFYDPKYSVGDYVDICGGGTSFANSGQIMLLRASGRVEKSVWFTKAQAGDTIIVPAKPLKIARYEQPFSWNEFWITTANAATTFAQTTTALITVYLLYKSVNQ